MNKQQQGFTLIEVLIARYFEGSADFGDSFTSINTHREAIDEQKIGFWQNPLLQNSVE